MNDIQKKAWRVDVARNRVSRLADKLETEIQDHIWNFYQFKFRNLADKKGSIYISKIEYLNDGLEITTKYRYDDYWDQQFTIPWSYFENPVESVKEIFRKEKEAQKKKEEEQKAAMERREIAEFERLKKKFEKA